MDYNPTNKNALPQEDSMTKILEIAQNILTTFNIADIETAAADIEMLNSPSPEEQYIIYLSAALARANTMLDARKQDVFADVLNLTTKGRVERAVTSYDKAYLLGLRLSLESIAELASELILRAKRFGVDAPDAWLDISKMRIEIKGEDIPTVSRTRASL